jgi:hypothetical protein
MGRAALKSVRAATWIALFCGAGFVFVRLAFALVCWVGGHNWTEALFGYVASIAFGAAIGIESYMWFREWNPGSSKQS